MNENEIAKRILDAAFVVHTKLGPGLLESVYEVVLAHELRKAGVLVERQKPMPITYDGILFEEGYRADLLVASKVIVELKSVASAFCSPRQASADTIAFERIKARTSDQFRRNAFEETASSESSTDNWKRKILQTFLCDLCVRCVRNLLLE